MHPEPKLEQLLNELTTGSLETQIQAGAALAELGAIAVAPMIELLKDPEKKHVWWLIASTLGRVGDPRTVEPLIALLKNPRSFDAILARKYTAWAFGDLKDVRAVEALIELLHENLYDEEQGGLMDEPDCETREAATWALTEVGDPRAVAPIFQSILEGCYLDPSGLAQFGEPALEFLLESLASTDAHVREHAASLLSEFSDPRATEPLIALLQNDPSDAVRRAAAHGLGELGDVRAYDALVTALTDRSEHTRANAAVALGQLKDRRAIEPLKKAAQDEHPEVRNRVQWALEWIELP